MFKKILIFFAGLAAGATGSFFVTNKVVSKKYDSEMSELIDQINAERAAIKAEYMSNKPDISTFKKQPEPEEPPVKKETDIPASIPDVDVEAVKPKKKPAASSKKKKPSVYEITEDEFNDVDNREKVLLSYYSDGVLANSYTDKQVDISATIGYDMLDLLGEEKLDSLHVRNESQNIDYEVTRDFREFREIVDRYVDSDPEY